MNMTLNELLSHKTSSLEDMEKYFGTVGNFLFDLLSKGYYICGPGVMQDNIKEA